MIKKNSSERFNMSSKSKWLITMRTHNPFGTQQSSVIMHVAVDRPEWTTEKHPNYYPRLFKNTIGHKVHVSLLENNLCICTHFMTLVKTLLPYIHSWKMHQKSRVNESYGKYSGWFIERGSTEKLEFLGNKVHVTANRKWFSRGRTAFLQKLFSTNEIKPGNKETFFSTGKVPCCLRKGFFYDL